MPDLDRSCDLSEHDLLLYTEGALRGARLEYVEIHVGVCAACQAWLQQFDDLGQLFQVSTPVSADPVRRATLLAHLNGLKRSRPPLASPQRPAAIVVLVAVFLLIAVPATTNANGFLGRYVRIGAIEIKESLDKPERLSVPTTIARSAAQPLAFPAVEPVTLPLGYTMVVREALAPRRLDTYFRDPNGYALQLSQEPASGGGVVVDSKSSEQVIVVRDTGVLYIGDHRLGVVSALFWEREGIGFGLVVVDEPAGGLQLHDAVRIVDAVMAAQDAP